MRDRGESSSSWLLLAHKVPRDPTSNRVYVWRKLKRLGAVLLHDAVWVLPANARTREQLRWLSTEIEELGGEVTLWESSRILQGDEERLVRQFSASVEADYRKILSELKNGHPDLATLFRRYRLLHAQDHFRSELGRAVRDALVAARGETRR